MEDIREEIKYWIEQAQTELNCFNPDGGKEYVYETILALNTQGVLRYYHLEGKKGVMAYVVMPDFRGYKSVQEVFMYIMPEYRGSLKLFKELVEYLEDVAKVEGAKSVRIASNIGYNDQTVLRCLKHFGYQDDVVVKYMEGV